MCHIGNRALTDVGTRYGLAKLETAGIKFACVHAFYKYLVGASIFEIVTDCKPLGQLFNNTTPRGRLRIERWILAIQGLVCVVKYQKRLHSKGHESDRERTQREGKRHHHETRHALLDQDDTEEEWVDSSTNTSTERP